MNSIPNKITLARVFFAPLFIVVILAPIPYREFLAALLFVVAASTDGLDGYLARKNKAVTTIGKFLDPLADKMLVSAALIALTWLKLIEPLSVFLIISREFAVTGLRVIAANQGLVIAASKWGKAKTLSQIIAITAITLNAQLTLGNSWIHRVIDFLPMKIISKAALALAVTLTLFSGLDYFIKNAHVWKKGLA